MSLVQAPELGEDALAKAETNHLADTGSDTKKDARALPASDEDLKEKGTQTDGGLAHGRI